MTMHKKVFHIVIYLTADSAPTNFTAFAVSEAEVLTSWGPPEAGNGSLLNYQITYKAEGATVEENVIIACTEKVRNCEQRNKLIILSIYGVCQRLVIILASP